jgi:hypothetical protein
MIYFIHCKKFCKCHNVPPTQQNNKKWSKKNKQKETRSSKPPIVNREQEGKTGLLEDWHQWEGGEYKEKMSEGEYGRNIMYSCMKMEK